jgi:hypothetical protein
MDTSQNNNRSAMHESPKNNVRRVFGELTNTLVKTNSLEQTPIKDEPKVEEEALTPLANLKMLIRVASETEPQLPPKRELFREDLEHDLDQDHDYLTSMTASSGLTNTLCDMTMMQENVTPSPGSTSSSNLGPPKVSRKQKSLGLLCEKFMSRFPESVPVGEKCEIPLDDLAKQMATERRRIYDIVNVLEAVQMMTKVSQQLIIYITIWLSLYVLSVHSLSPPKPAGLYPQKFRRRTLYYMRKSLGIIFLIFGKKNLIFFLINIKKKLRDFFEFFSVKTRSVAKHSASQL